MRFAHLAVLAALGSVLAISPLHSAAAQSDDVVNLRSGEPIVVTGEREIEQDEVRDAVRDIAMRGRSFDRPMTQYQMPICITVAGLGDRFNTQVAERIKANTLDASFEVAEPGCETNALVIVVRNPDRLIKRLRKERPRLFNVKVSQRIKAAQNRNDAAIAWSLTRMGGTSGSPLQSRSTIAGAAGTELFDNAGAQVPQTQRLGTSRSKINFSSERALSIIIFDIDRLNNVHLDQLADFATMRLLANPQPTIDIEAKRADSILNLFDVDPLEAPQQMTQLDRAFLRGLYTMRPNDPSTRLEHFVLSAYEDIRNEDCQRVGDNCVQTP